MISHLISELFNSLNEKKINYAILRYFNVVGSVVDFKIKKKYNKITRFGNLKKVLNGIDEAQKNGINLPITKIVDQFYEEIQTIGGGRWDTSSLLKRLIEKP